MYISGAKNHDFLSKVDIFVRTEKLISKLNLAWNMSLEDLKYSRTIYSSRALHFRGLFHVELHSFLPKQANIHIEVPKVSGKYSKN